MNTAAPDPWVIRQGGYYYFTCTSNRFIQIWKSPTLTGLNKAPKTIVWRAPSAGPNSQDIWAPELHFLRGKWYIYYTARASTNMNRRLFVLEAKTDDPMGEYAEKGQLTPPKEDEDAIDANVFEQGGALYVLWAGRENVNINGTSIYIAPMSDPWTISGPRVKLSSPQYDWETRGWNVNEAPQALQRNGQTFIVYSASSGGAPDYCLGMLTNNGGDLLNSAAWRKSATAVFSSYEGPDGNVYNVGHNSFTTSPDGAEDWMVYHAKDTKAVGWAGRLPRAQKFAWNADGTPNFGHPIPSRVRIPLPSG